MAICGEKGRDKRNPSASRSQLRQKSGATARSSSDRSAVEKKGISPTNIAPAPASHRSDDARTARSAMDAVQAVVQKSSRSGGTEASLSSSRDARGLYGGSDSGRGPFSARTTTPRSRASSVTSPTDYSTDTPRETARGTARTTTTMAMSTARAEATLAVLEAERAQLEHRLKKVEDELRQEQTLAMSEHRKRGAGRGVPRRVVR